MLANGVRRTNGWSSAATPRDAGYPGTGRAGGAGDLGNSRPGNQCLAAAVGVPVTVWGAQSLSPAANGRETVDATLYAGIRPWPGGEICGSIRRSTRGSGSATPLARRDIPAAKPTRSARRSHTYWSSAFLRQTIDLGGETEKLDPDLNQLGGTPTGQPPGVHDRQIFHRRALPTPISMRTTRATTSSTGRSSDQGAFDYAANSWGHTYGGAAEWYQDWWTARGRPVRSAAQAEQR